MPPKGNESQQKNTCLIHWNNGQNGIHAEHLNGNIDRSLTNGLFPTLVNSPPTKRNLRIVFPSISSLCCILFQISIYYQCQLDYGVSEKVMEFLHSLSNIIEMVNCQFLFEYPQTFEFVCNSMSKTNFSK